MIRASQGWGSQWLAFMCPGLSSPLVQPPHLALFLSYSLGAGSSSARATRGGGAFSHLPKVLRRWEVIQIRTGAQRQS